MFFVVTDKIHASIQILHVGAYVCLNKRQKADEGEREKASELVHHTDCPHRRQEGVSIITPRWPIHMQSEQGI